MVEIEVRRVRDDEYPEWDKLVTASPQGTVFHLSDWAVPCACFAHRQPLLLGYYEDARLIGGCLLYVTAKFRFMSFATSTAPMTPYGGFLLSEIGSTKVREKEIQDKSIVLAISDEISKMGFISTKIINAPTLQDIRPFTWNNWACRVYYTYVLPLTGDISLHISKNVRRTIRKGQKNDIDVRKCYDPEVYWDLTVSTYEKQHQKPPFTKAFLLSMLNVIVDKNLGEMWIARTPTGEAASAEVVTWDNHMAHRWSAASDSTYNDTGATSLLLFEIFQDLQKKGFNKINLMAGNTPQLSMFVSSFNPELVPYYGVGKSQFQFDRSSFSRLWEAIRAKCVGL